MILVETKNEIKGLQCLPLSQSVLTGSWSRQRSVCSHGFTGHRRAFHRTNGTITFPIPNIHAHARVLPSHPSNITSDLRVPPAAQKWPSRGACLRSGRVCFLCVTKPRLPESVKELRHSPIHHLHFRSIVIRWVRSDPRQRSAGCFSGH